MPDGRAAAYGSWKSPITSELIVSRTVGFDQTAVDGEDIYWTEMRPAEGGRYVVVRRTRDGRAEDVTPAPFNARTLVHEYGGGAVAGGPGGGFFSDHTGPPPSPAGAGGAPGGGAPRGGGG